MQNYRTKLAAVLSSSVLATSAWAASVVTIPEPNILTLFGFGAASMVLLARYFRKK
jgi:hypothetical protein